MTTRSGTTIVLLLANSSSAAAQVPDLWHDQIGYRICPVRDANGDGAADFVLDDGLGALWLISGKNGTTLAQPERQPGVTVGWVQSLFDDVDGDGTWDFLDVREVPKAPPVQGPPVGPRVPGNAASMRFYDTRSVRASVELRSGKTLAVLREWKHATEAETFNYSMAPLGDWNGDSVLDFAICAREPDASVLLYSIDRDAPFGSLRVDPDWLKHGHAGRFASRVECSRERAENRRVLAVHARGRGDSWGTPCEGGYVAIYANDTKGRPQLIARETALVMDDFVAGFVPDAKGGAIPSLVLHGQELTGLFASSSGERQRDLSRPDTLLKDRPPWVHHGVAVPFIDKDGDGVRDFLVSFPWFLGFVRLYSSRDGKVLQEWKESSETCSESCRFGASLEVLGDVDGDRIDDFAIGTTGGIDYMFPGNVSVYSGKTGARLYVVWKRDLLAK